MTDKAKDCKGNRWLSRSVVNAALAIATMLVLAGLAARAAMPAQAAQTPTETPTYTVLYSFTGGADGGLAFAGLIPDAAGNLYGTSYVGGVYGWGVVFKLDPAGNETVLHAFTGGADGAQPLAGLIRDTAGNFYGTTQGGGAYNAGVVFKLDPAGNETVLYAFTGGADGAWPQASLIRDAAGNLYGTTWGGGDYGRGVVFKLDPAGNETVLHTFRGADGAVPSAGLIVDAAGDLYGTTAFGGNTSACPNNGPGYPPGCGVLFKLVNPKGTEKILHRFTFADGAWPWASLIRDTAGNLYGTTEFGGAYAAGVVFKLDPQGNETVLYAFTGGADGYGPQGAGVIRDAAGNLYGTTVYGGDLGCALDPAGCGVVFKVDPAGNETVLHSFTGGADGAFPPASLLPYKGALYGTAPDGGAYGFGVVFKLTLH